MVPASRIGLEGGGGGGGLCSLQIKLAKPKNFLEKELARFLYFAVNFMNKI